MTLYTIYRQKEYIKYFNHFFSKSTLFVFIFTIVPLFVSGISAYRAYGFYKTSVFIASQPVVNLKPDMVVVFLTTTGTLTWSNLLSASSNCMPTISIVETDANFDGIKESLNITVKLYKPNITGVRFLLQFDYSVASAISNLQLQQPIVVSADSSQPNLSLVVMGQLGVNQKRRLPSRGVLLMYNTSYLDGSSSNAALTNPFDNINAFNAARNVTVSLKNVFTSWRIPSNPNVFEMNIEIAYAPVELHYHADFWTMIKWGWVQWFYFLLFFAWIFQKIKEFVFASFTLSAKKRCTQLHRCNIGLHSAGSM